MTTETLVNEWFGAGMKAWQEGKKRTDYPFKQALRRSGLDVVWQIGWDTGAMMHAMQQGQRAQRNDPNPYSTPALAAYWTQGWSIAHGLQVIQGNKNPASREKDAKPGTTQK